MTEKERSRKKLSHVADGQAVAAKRRGLPHADIGVNAAALQQTLWGICGAIAAFLLERCTLLFGARPLGIALLCAATHGIPYLYGGLAISALTAQTGGVVMLCAYTAALVIRIVSRSAIELPGAGRPPVYQGDDGGEGEQALLDTEPSEARRRVSLRVWCVRAARRYRELMSKWFSENVYLRMMTACVCAFIVSLYTIISGGFLYYDLFGAFFAMVTAPAATFLYAGLFSVCADDVRAMDTPTARRIYRAVAIAALSFSVLFSLRPLALMGISLSACAGLMLTLCVTRRRGLLQGLAAGLLCGLAHAPVLVPSFALAAVAFWLLCRFSSLIAAAAACGAALGWSFVPLGVGTLSTFLPSALTASLMICAMDKLLTRPTLLLAPPSDTARIEVSEQAEVEARRAALCEARMRELSEAFSSLADVFYSLSDRMKRPGLLDLRRMCDRAFDAVCPDCPGRDLCWGGDYVGTLTRLSRMAAALHERGRVEVSDLDESFAARCEALPRLCESMNAECARMTEAALLTGKTEVFAMDFEGLSRVLEDALASQQDDFWYDEELCEEIRRAMLAMDLRTEGVVVFGKRRRQIVARGVDATASTLGAAAIRRRLEQVCGFSLGELSFDLGDTGVTMRVSTRPRFAVRTVTRTAAAGGGICGDTVNVFHSERELSYALISDGMGSGAEAAFTSGMCSLFLEKMLMAGNRGETALRMLNSMIRQKGGGIGMECSATVDLMELDLICGRAVFLKSGAAPTYVRRDDSLFRLHARTAPIGILRSVDAQRLAYDVAPGDVIIMLSDGVAAEDGIEENGGECVWLLDLLSDGWEEDMDSMADVILRRAREEGSADDLSVILIRVEEAFE